MAGGNVAIAIDGPAASGKSSVARGVAEQLGFTFVSSGLMYRAFSWHVLRCHVDPNDTTAVVRLLKITEFECGEKDGEGTISVNGVDAGDQLTAKEVNAIVSTIAAIPEVRERLVAEQRRYQEVTNVVMEGRDIGTVVFADTPYKFYLDASPEVREQRRRDQGIQDDIRKRDEKDSSRETAPLKVADDAVVVDTSDLTLQGVIQEVCRILAARGVTGSASVEPYRGERMSFLYWLGWSISGFFTHGIYRMRVFNREKCRIPGGCLLAANHTSFLDPPIVGTALNEAVYYVARETLFSNRFSAWLLPRINSIPLNQEAADLKSLRRIIASVKTEGKKVVIFPEGTRSRDGNFLPAQRGIGMLVSKMQCPVVPVRIFGGPSVYPRGSKFPRLRGKLYVVFGDPIYFTEEQFKAKGKEAYQEIADTIMDRIKELRIPEGG